ncbi:MAG: CHAD domain-containing protein [Deltaproteobacteria bacterium]|nr:CHAD domain-containing protein [Deltaproteobacteria bacterium]
MKSGKASMEMELKLTLPPDAAEADVVAYLREEGYVAEDQGVVENCDIYLDTYDWLLLKSKLALRYRTANGEAMYTVKGMGLQDDGIAKRMETEIKLEGLLEKPADVRIRQIRNIVDEIIFPRKLIEQIQIRTHRRLYKLIPPEGGKIELAFDTSRFSLKGIHNSRRVRKLQELEAELKQGTSQALKALAGLLAKKFNYPSSPVSKLECALERLNVVVPSKKIPEKWHILRTDRFDLAVRKILSYQWQRFQDLLPGVKKDIDSEFVHQARVATRRMRSALRLFQAAVPESTGAYFGAELKWLGALFGSVRDLDVFLLNLPGFQMQMGRFGNGKLRIFENWIDEHRRRPFDDLCDGLNSQRFANFSRRLTRFLQTPLPVKPRATMALKKVEDAAPEIILQKFAAVMEQGHNLSVDPKIKQYHLLRIEMKKLRYACEFLAPAYGEALNEFIEKVVSIQDCLGQLQDTVFTRQFVDYLYKDWLDRMVKPELIFILGELYQLQAQIAGQCRDRFSGIWAPFMNETSSTILKKALL